METGITNVKRYVVVDDCGRILNKVIVDGQIHGGVFNGIAATLFEKHVYGERDNYLLQLFPNI